MDGLVVTCRQRSGGHHAHSYRRALELENVGCSSHISLVPTIICMSDMLSRRRIFMLEAKQREVAETVFDRNKRREAEINDALRQEHARHGAAVKNMHRLRALRLAREAKKDQ